MLPLRLGKLIPWYFATYFVVLRLQQLLRGSGGIAQIGDYFDSPHRLALAVTSHLSFATYAIGAYLVLRSGYQRYHAVVLGAALSCLLVCNILLRALLEEVMLYHLFGAHNYNPGMSWSAYFRDNLYYAAVFLPVGLMFFFVQYSRYTEVLHHRTEVTLREVELKFLRSQINPHFLFNTLNNLYALVSTNNAHSLDAIEKLGSLLRYSLYTQEQLVPLDRELTYVRDLVYLESLRVVHPAPPRVVVTGNTEDWEIPPLLLVPFVENALKHGALRLPAEPLRIKLDAAPDCLTFTVVNPVRQPGYRVDGTGGIGLLNVRKRLDILYPGAYDLTIDRLPATFAVRLIIHRTAA